MAVSDRHEVTALFDMSGGINTRFAKTSMAENELEDCYNFHLDDRGGIEKRRGYEPHVTLDTATGTAISGVWQHRDTTNGDLVMRIEDTNIDYDNAGTWTSITGTETVTTGQNNRWLFQTFRGSTVFTNGTDVPLKWSGSGNVSKITRAIDGGADTIDKAGTLAKHRERIILGDVTATESSVQTRYESVLWPSDAGTLDTWSGAPIGKVHLGRGDGDSITNLQDTLGHLVAFKQHSFYRVTELGSFQNQRSIFVAPIGTPGPHSAVVANDLVYFIDAIGQLWVYDPRQGDSPDAVVNLSGRKLGRGTLNDYVRDRLQYAHLIHEPVRDEIWCFMPQDGSTETNMCWVYKIATGGFARFEWDVNWNVSCNALDADGNPTVLAGSFGGLVGLLDTGTLDDGTIYSAFVVTRPTALGDLAIMKGTRRFDLYSNSGTTHDVTVTQLFDFNGSGPHWDVAARGQYDVLA